MNLQEQLTELARRAKAAARALALLNTAEKNQCLLAMADRLEQQTSALLEANREDMQAAEAAGLRPAMLDRLRLDAGRVQAMARGLREVAALPDPVGRILDERVRPNGLRLRKVTVPIGVIVIIYEARPNVTADAAGLCFKSGNATILRGGREAFHTNRLIAALLVQAGQAALGQRFPAEAIQLVPTAEREAIPILLSLTSYVDLCIPRGGEGLIRAVAECSRVPVIKHYKGVCHVYVDRDADPDMAERIVINAKCQRPAVCNAMETLLVDRSIAAQFLPRVGAELARRKVQLRADAEAIRLLSGVRTEPPLELRPAIEQDWYTEYNDLILNVRVVNGVQEAIEHINQYGSAHSDAIVTANETTAQRFLNGVDAAAVYWNASTRFTDGGEFGMGAEIGISTDKVGARGPMGLEELTSYKWIGIGQGQIRT
ncbi:MAG: glutamate-5-semialdehyde dehydrogenase [Verrucomicrobiota bacterium]|nr:glutamate-5-semialdehyde dehydrogenase [Limisphaera sp.]MDW8380837.1 glutamate-5-semialdehyde dehydrogenase [Verrucomicrobiota bacterium]